MEKRNFSEKSTKWNKDKGTQVCLREAIHILENLRDENVRASEQVIEIWDEIISKVVDRLGKQTPLILEQVCLAAFDCNRADVWKICLSVLHISSSPQEKYLEVLALEASERHNEALTLLDSMIQSDETNVAAYKRRIAIFKAKGRIPDAIKELTTYLEKFMADAEAWQELSELYLSEYKYSKAAFCLEELILHSPHNHLFHQRYAEICYTQGGADNLEIAQVHYRTALKLSPNNIRALYGLFLTALTLAMSKHFSNKKKKRVSYELAQWVLKDLNKRYPIQQLDNSYSTESLECLLSSVRL